MSDASAARASGTGRGFDPITGASRWLLSAGSIIFYRVRAYGIARALLVRSLTIGLILVLPACAAVARSGASRRQGTDDRTAAPARSVAGASDASGATAPVKAPTRSKSGSRSAQAETRVVRHRVAPGQTLFRIASLYGVTVEALARANGISDPTRLRVGALLTIPRAPTPGARRAPSGPSGLTDPLRAGMLGEIAPLAPGPSGTPIASPAGRAPSRHSLPEGTGDPADMEGSVPGKAEESSEGEDWAEEDEGSDIGPSGVTYTLIPSEEPFTWPVQGGTIYSPFGRRHGRLHAGIDIAAPMGTLVYAARDGVVTFSGRKRGYGNVIVIDHGDEFATLYAHTSRNLVREGDRVVQGQLIARVGATGNATGTHCHFEIRKDNVALDPTRYLTAVQGETSSLASAASPSQPRKPARINNASIIPIP